MFKTFSANLNRLREMLAFVCKQSHDVGFEEPSISKIELACEEALVNIMNHGYLHDAGKISIECLFLDSQGIKIVISDEGLPFNPLMNVKPIHQPIESKALGGYGIHLILSLMDKVTYIRENNKNKLTLIKYKKPEPLD
jgi:serine/threonine-protein kinase RsbW